MQKLVILKTIYEPGITDGKQRTYPRGQISGKVQEVRITTMGVSLVDAYGDPCVGNDKKRWKDNSTVERKKRKGPRFIVVRQLPAMVPLIRPR